jgi:hypothetical protein
MKNNGKVWYFNYFFQHGSAFQLDENIQVYEPESSFCIVIQCINWVRRAVPTKELGVGECEERSILIAIVVRREFILWKSSPNGYLSIRIFHHLIYWICWMLGFNTHYLPSLVTFSCTSLNKIYVFSVLVQFNLVSECHARSKNCFSITIGR